MKLNNGERDWRDLVRLGWLMRQIALTGQCQEDRMGSEALL